MPAYSLLSMTKVVLNGEIIELSDELEKGKAELDLLQEDQVSEEINLEDTIEIRVEGINENK